MVNSNLKLFMLSYGVVGGVVGVLIDENLRRAKTTHLDSICKFCKAGIAVFSEIYLREPNVADHFI
jgi:hypothetical protein